MLFTFFPDLTIQSHFRMSYWYRARDEVLEVVLKRCVKYAHANHFYNRFSTTLLCRWTNLSKELPPNILDASTTDPIRPYLTKSLQIIRDSSSVIFSDILMHLSKETPDKMCCELLAEKMPNSFRFLDGPFQFLRKIRYVYLTSGGAGKQFLCEVSLAIIVYRTTYNGRQFSRITSLHC